MKKKKLPLSIKTWFFNKKKITSIYNTACDKLIMHCTYEAIILQHHQIQSSKGAREENGCSFAAIL